MLDGQRYVSLSRELIDMSAELEQLGGGDVRLGRLDSFVRISPMQEVQTVLLESESTLLLRSPNSDSSSQKRHRHTFTACFPPMTEQSEIYASVGIPLLDWLWDGFDATLIAHGQSHTGKSYTLFGRPPPIESDGKGLVPRLLQDLFRKIQSDPETWSVGISCFEVFGDAVIDLLGLDGEAKAPLPQPASRAYPAHAGLHSLDDPRNCLSVHARSYEECDALLRYARLRSVNWSDSLAPLQAMGHGADSCHFLPNRAHSFLRVLLYHRPLRRLSALHIVDLVGSHPMSHASSHAVDAAQRAERKVVSQHLLAFSRVLSELAASSTNATPNELSKSQGPQDRAAASISIPIPMPQIPHPALPPTAGATRLISARETRLTRVLAPLIAHNAKTVLLSTISGASEHHIDTTNTLRLASRAQSICSGCARSLNIDEDDLSMRPFQEHAVALHTLLERIERQQASQAQAPQMMEGRGGGSRVQQFKASVLQPKQAARVSLSNATHAEHEHKYRTPQHTHTHTHTQHTQFTQPAPQRTKRASSYLGLYKQSKPTPASVPAPTPQDNTNPNDTFSSASPDSKKDYLNPTSFRPPSHRIGDLLGSTHPQMQMHLGQDGSPMRIRGGVNLSQSQNSLLDDDGSESDGEMTQGGLDEANEGELHMDSTLVDGPSMGGGHFDFDDEVEMSPGGQNGNDQPMDDPNQEPSDISLHDDDASQGGPGPGPVSPLGPITTEDQGALLGDAEMQRHEETVFPSMEGSRLGLEVTRGEEREAEEEEEEEERHPLGPSLSAPLPPSSPLRPSDLSSPTPMAHTHMHAPIHTHTHTDSPHGSESDDDSDSIVDIEKESALHEPGEEETFTSTLLSPSPKARGGRGQGDAEQVEDEEGSDASEGSNPPEATVALTGPRDPERQRLHAEMRSLLQSVQTTEDDASPQRATAAQPPQAHTHTRTHTHTLASPPKPTSQLRGQNENRRNKGASPSIVKRLGRPFSHPPAEALSDGPPLSKRGAASRAPPMVTFSPPRHRPTPTPAPHRTTHTHTHTHTRPRTRSPPRLRPQRTSTTHPQAPLILPRSLQSPVKLPFAHPCPLDTSDLERQEADLQASMDEKASALCSLEHSRVEVRVPRVDHLSEDMQSSLDRMIEDAMRRQQGVDTVAPPPLLAETKKSREEQEENAEEEEEIESAAAVASPLSAAHRSRERERVPPSGVKVSLSLPQSQAQSQAQAREVPAAVTAAAQVEERHEVPSKRGKKSNAEEELEHLRASYDSLLVFLENAEKARKRAEERMQDMEHQMMEQATTYELKLEDARMASQQAQHRLRNLQRNGPSSALFEMYERDLTRAHDENKRILQENASLHERYAIAIAQNDFTQTPSPSPSPSPHLPRSTHAHAPMSPDRPGKGGGAPHGKRGAPLVAADKYLRRVLAKTQKEAETLREANQELLKKKRCWAASQKLIEESNKKMNALSRELAARDADLQRYAQTEDQLRICVKEHELEKRRLLERDRKNTERLIALEQEHKDLQEYVSKLAKKYKMSQQVSPRYLSHLRGPIGGTATTARPSAPTPAGTSAVSPSVPVRAFDPSASAPPQNTNTHAQPRKRPAATATATATRRTGSSAVQAPSASTSPLSALDLAGSPHRRETQSLPGSPLVGGYAYLSSETASVASETPKIYTKPRPATAQLPRHTRHARTGGGTGSGGPPLRGTGPVSMPSRGPLTPAPTMAQAAARHRYAPSPQSTRRTMMHP